METITMNGCEAKVFYLNNVTNIMDMEKFRQYVNGAESFIDFFGEEIVSVALTLTDSKFLEFAKPIDATDDEANYIVKQGFYLGSERKTIDREIYKGGDWHKTVKMSGYRVWVKSPYQNNSKIFRAAMLLKYPWLEKFPNLVFYSICFGNIKKEIFYLNCGKNMKDGHHYNDKMLYIYMSDFITGNFVKCMESHINYYRNYYKWPGGWCKDVTKEQVEDWRTEYCSIATTPEALRFYSEMELNRLRGQGIKC